MKKIIFLLTTALLVVNVSVAQFTVATYNPDDLTETGEITDGEVYTFTSTNYEEASIYFWIKNDNAHDINVRIVYEEITNADGTDFEFCFGGLCIFAVEEGVNYPEEGGPVVIEAGGKTVDYDHFLNKNNGSGTFPMDYVITFFEVDGDDNPIGNPITFTYRYDPTASVNDFTSLQAQVMNTVVDLQLNIHCNEPLQLQVYDLQGKLLMQETLQTGINNIVMNNLNSGLYFAKLANTTGTSEVFKFVKK